MFTLHISSLLSVHLREPLIVGGILFLSVNFFFFFTFYELFLCWIFNIVVWLVVAVEVLDSNSIIDGQRGNL